MKPQRYTIWGVTEKGEGKVIEIGSFEIGEIYELPLWAYDSNLLVTIEPTTE